MNLRGASSEIASYAGAGEPGSPLFAMFGGNAVGPVDATSFGNGGGEADFARLYEQLQPLGSVPLFAAAGPFDRVPDEPNNDALRAWSEAFAGAPAPFGSGSPAPGITPVSEGAAENEVHRYYSFQAAQNGAAVLVVVLDTSVGAGLEPNERAWLIGQLEANANSPSPLSVVVVSGTPLRASNAGSNEAVAELLTEPRWNGEVVAVFSPDGTGTRPFHDGEDHELNEVRLVPEQRVEGPQIPEYEGATLGYQQSANNGVDWYLASIDTQTRSVSVSAIPVIASLDLKPVDGLTSQRSKTLQFEAIARRPPSTLATGFGEEPAFEGWDQYVQIPAGSCKSGRCIEPSYSFTSSHPGVGNFVEATGEGSPFPKLNGKGHPIASRPSGLFCAYNPGTTNVTVTAGLLSYTQTVTVLPGGVSSPCGTVTPEGAGTRHVRRTTESQAGAGAAPPTAPPTALSGVNPSITAVPPAPAPPRDAARTEGTGDRTDAGPTRTGAHSACDRTRHNTARRAHPARVRRLRAEPVRRRAPGEGT